MNVLCEQLAIYIVLLLALHGFFMDFSWKFYGTSALVISQFFIGLRISWHFMHFTNHEFKVFMEIP